MLTLDRTPLRPESCSFPCSPEPWEVPADEGDAEGDTAVRRGLVSSGMKAYFGLRGDGDPTQPSPPPPIGYHGQFTYGTLEDQGSGGLCTPTENAETDGQTGRPLTIALRQGKSVAPL